MLAHVSIGVRDVDTSRAFYDDALAAAWVSVHKGPDRPVIPTKAMVPLGDLQRPHTRSRPSTSQPSRDVLT
jgi:catechol 2,3-dioxygenase-like lactoylglutathione lyase family enzyme